MVVELNPHHAKDAIVSSPCVSTYPFAILYATKEAFCETRKWNFKLKYIKSAHVAGKERLENPLGKKASQLSS